MNIPTILHRAAAALAIVIISASEAWAQGVVEYIDANGRERYCTLYTTLRHGSNTTLGNEGVTRWYVLPEEEDLNFFSPLTINGDVNIILTDGKKMTVKGNGYAAIVLNGNLTIYGQANSTGTLTAIGERIGINSNGNYNLTINGGTVNISGDHDTGIHVNNFTVNGGKVTATGDDYGIEADGDITLSWRNPTDRIYSTSYPDIIKITKPFTDGTNTYNGEAVEDYRYYCHMDVNPSGKTLYAANDVHYIDEDGDTHTVTAAALDGSETTLAEGWYVASGTVNFDHGITLSGDVHLILADYCHMSMGSSTNRIDDIGINCTGTATLTVTSQSLSPGVGDLTIYSHLSAISASDLTINGGYVTADTDGDNSNALAAICGDLTINGGIIRAAGTGTYADAINAGKNFHYNGGNVTAIGNGNGYAIKADSKHYTFNWRNAADCITIGTTGLYTSGKTATFSKAFTDGTVVYLGEITGNDLSTLAGKTFTAYDGKLGDIVRDDRFTATDVQTLVYIILGQPSPEYDTIAADVNHDRRISIADVTALVKMIIENQE